MKGIQKILIVAATEGEIAKVRNLSASFPSLQIQFLISGVGAPATIFSLTKKLCNDSYDLVMNVGIAGAFRNRFSVGDVVQVVTDVFADLGIDNRGEFIPITESGFVDANQFPYVDGRFQNEFVLPELPQAVGITANTAHGSELLINQIEQQWHADIETMEGAAVAYVCLMHEQAFCQVRAISNIVEIRNRANWNIPMAIANLKSTLIRILENFEKQ